MINLQTKIRLWVIICRGITTNICRPLGVGYLVVDTWIFFFLLIRIILGAFTFSTPEHHRLQLNEVRACHKNFKETPQIA